MFWEYNYLHIRDGITVPKFIDIKFFCFIKTWSLVIATNNFWNQVFLFIQHFPKENICYLRARATVFDVRKMLAA
jgi:hypothetical protein